LYEGEEVGNASDFPYNTKQVSELPQWWKDKLQRGRVWNFCCLRGKSEDGTTLPEGSKTFII